jgi:ribonuclease BN (tRNA processing enzyme)
VGRVAAQAEVKTLVLSHFVPAEDPELTGEKWTEAVRRRHHPQQRLLEI